MDEKITKNLDIRDTLKEGWSAVFTLTLNKTGEPATSRTLTIDYITAAMPDYSPEKENIGSFRQLLLGKFNKFLQPSGWRDNDSAEDEWTVTEVAAKMIYKSEAELDFDES